MAVEWIVALSTLLVVNIFGFILMGIDKQRARKGKYRISENTLWFVAIFGGATGMTVGMNYFRHKTKHLQFKLGLPSVMLLHFVFIAVAII